MTSGKSLASDHPVGGTDRIDILTLLHNDRDRIDAYLNAVSETSMPVCLHVLDNGSTDGTADLFGRRIEGLDIPVHFHRSVRNLGFAAGMNMLARQVDGPFLFLLNSDARLRPGCLALLAERAARDPGIGICEAWQVPDPHPKAMDTETGETTWCSGAAALIRREAFDEVGGFDEKLFFMYCEDIDLSWRMWLTGWKCVVVPEAQVEHPVGSARQRPRRRGWAHYFSFRNSLFIYHRFRRSGDLGVLGRFLARRFLSRRYSFLSKALFAIAFADHIRYIPYLRRTGRLWSGRHHPWIRLRETSLVE